MQILSRLYDAARWILRVVGNAAYKFYWDDGFSRASGLAYTTLFALVPVTALSVSVFHLFGVREEEFQHALNRILEQVLPQIETGQMASFQNEVFSHLQQFSGNVSALNTASIAALVFTSIALLNTIESALNVIWRVTSETSLFAKVTSFWAVVTLGPLCIALSLYWSARFEAFAQSQGVPLLQDWFHLFLNFGAPLVASWCALTILFFKLPAARVRVREAAFGALIAAALFEFAKAGFSYGVSRSSTYSTLYGVLVAIPLFLFWLYIAWVVILFGAQISYHAGSLHSLQGRRKYATDMGEVGSLLGLRILLVIGRRFVAGVPAPEETDIAVETGSDPVLVRACLDLLTDAGLLSIVDPETHSRSLLVSPEHLKLARVFETFLSKSQRGQGPAQSEFLNHVTAQAQGTGRSTNVADWTLLDLVGNPSS